MKYFRNHAIGMTRKVLARVTIFAVNIGNLLLFPRYLGITFTIGDKLFCKGE